MSVNDEKKDVFGPTELPHSNWFTGMASIFIYACIGLCLIVFWTQVFSGHKPGFVFYIGGNAPQVLPART